MLASTYLLLVTAAAWDTVVAVRPGSRLEVHDLTGEIVVQTWPRNEVAVSATGASSDVELTLRSGVVTLRRRSQGVTRGHARHAISVPAWMAVTVRARRADVRISGVRAPLSVETRVGDITVDGGRDRITLTAFGGAVRLRRATGAVELRSVSSPVDASDIEGSLRIATADGAVTLGSVRAGIVSVRTVGGRIEYRGAIAALGQYHFATHDGMIRVAIPEAVPVLLHVDRYRADFSSELTSLRAPHDSARRFQRTHRGTPGQSGTAHMRIESFAGPVWLLRGKAVSAGSR